MTHWPDWDTGRIKVPNIAENMVSKSLYITENMEFYLSCNDIQRKTVHQIKTFQSDIIV